MCGVDVAYDSAGTTAFAAAVLMRLPELEVVENRTAASPVLFPYIPGLLGFREAPAILEALALLKTRPQLLMVDGHGIAHPRRCGVASMLGLALDIPSIGCAKSLLVGEYPEPGPAQGDRSALVDHSETVGETIGIVVRTRPGVRPIFVSVGHGVSLAFAVRTALAATQKFRLPLPTHLADRLAGRAKGPLAQGRRG